VVALGVQTWSTDVAAVERFWRAADSLGYARITYGDGLWDFTLDGWTMLGALAAATRRARIGPAVTYAFDPAAHHPSWLAKRAVTVDHLSGGRLDVRFAVGAGDAATRDAWQRHGIRYPAGAERVAALEEALVAIGALWRGETVDGGGVFRLQGARLAPSPVQRPGPPVWIAAMGPRALALTARRADGWEASYVTPPDFAALAVRLDGLLAAAGRRPADVRRSVEVDVILADSPRERETWTRRFAAERGVGPGHAIHATALAGDADAVAARVGEYAAAGATDLMLGFVDFPATGMLERFARDVVPRLTSLSPSGGRGTG
jgi:alkanesulfonate monooxygenase SsuD/methylene tetrahydromethanopterin reductase-like flavin-dependent oxidoreductase (luciferase family)